MRTWESCSKHIMERVMTTTQSTNRITANHLREKNYLSEITDEVYAMARAMEIKL